MKSNIHGFDTFCYEVYLKCHEWCLLSATVKQKRNKELRTIGTRAIDGTRQNILGTPPSNNSLRQKQWHMTKCYGHATPQ